MSLQTAGKQPGHAHQWPRSPWPLPSMTMSLQALLDCLDYDPVIAGRKVLATPPACSGPVPIPFSFLETCRWLQKCGVQLGEGAHTITCTDSIESDRQTDSIESGFRVSDCEGPAFCSPARFRFCLYVMPQEGTIWPWDLGQWLCPQRVRSSSQSPRL